MGSYKREREGIGITEWIAGRKGLAVLYGGIYTLKELKGKLSKILLTAIGVGSSYLTKSFK